MASLVGSASSFDKIYQHLLTQLPPLLPPPGPLDKTLTDQISSLYVHPCLEAALHLLNQDLESAHFLVRHMQAAPMHEGMYLHGILHRIEGDYDNARAWYGDVADSDVFKSVWKGAGGLDEAKGLIQRVEELNAEKTKKQDDPTWQSKKGELERESSKEINAVVTFCKDKFGTEPVQDASVAWKQPEQGSKISKIKEGMTTGDEGHRKF